MSQVNTARSSWMTYMKGWRDGAGAKALDPKFTAHQDAHIVEAYTVGYKDGYKARGEASAIAAERYGYQPMVIRAMGGLTEGKIRKGGQNSPPDPATRPGPPTPHPPKKNIPCPFQLSEWKAIEAVSCGPGNHVMANPVCEACGVNTDREKELAKEHHEM